MTKKRERKKRKRREARRQNGWVSEKPKLIIPEELDIDTPTRIEASGVEVFHLIARSRRDCPRE